MLKALMSRFSDEPVMMALSSSTVLEGLVSGLAASENIEKLMSDVSAHDSSFWYSQDDWRSSYRPYNVKDGLLTIPVKGALLSGFPYAAGWATGYEYIWEAVKRGMDDSAVKGIAFLINSPGGEVAGNFDLVDRIYALRGKKKMAAFAHEYAYSAAYSIASAADTITVSRTGGVGSIGVVTSHVDMSKMLDEAGYKITFIHFGDHKVDGNPYEPLKPEVKQRIQARIDELGKVFVATVARNRGMDESAIKGTEALTFTAQEAVSNGLADAIGPLDDAVAAFAAGLSTEEGDEHMSTKTDAAVDQAAIDTARTEAHAAGKAEGHAAGLKEGATAEKARINAILGSDEGKKRPSAALAAALDTDLTAEQAATFLGKLAEEKTEAAAPAAPANGQSFATAMGEDKPNVGADAQASGDADEDDASGLLSLAGNLNISGFRKRA